jgi:hypothetical protein
MSGVTPLDAAAMIATREQRFARGLAWLNGLSKQDASSALARCCAASRWVSAMEKQRPFPTSWSLFAAARDEWNRCSQRELRRVLGPSGPMGKAALVEASREHDKLIRQRLEQLLASPPAGTDAGDA